MSRGCFGVKASLILFTLAFSSASQAADPPPVDQAQQVLAQRIQRIDGAPLDAGKTGYFRAVVTANMLTKDNLCPATSEERNNLKKLNEAIWTIALKRKKDWGAAAQLIYDGSKNPDFDDPNLHVNQYIKFFAVHMDGASPDKCQPDVINFQTYNSPLILLNNNDSTNVFIQFSTWWNETNDRGNIDKIVRGGTFLLGLTGLPVGALQTTEPAAVDKIKEILDKHKSVKYQVNLDPSTKQVDAVAYLGLREPKKPASANDLQIDVKIVPVASIFQPLAGDFNAVDLSAWSAHDILDFQLSAPTAADAAAKTSLKNWINGKNNNGIDNMVGALSNAVASGLCDALDQDLEGNYRFSKVDAAIVLYGIALRRIENGVTANVNEIQCILNRKNTLALVKVTVTDPKPKILPKAATRDQMLDAMNTFTAFRFAPADGVPSSTWAILSFPLSIYDPADKFGWIDQQASFALADRDAFKAAIDKGMTNIGCWAYFPDLPISFGPGLGTPGSDSFVRKSAALVRLQTGEVEILQFRYNDDPAGPKIDGLAFVKADTAAKAQMLNNESCKPSVPNREWMQSYLRP